MNRFLTRGLYSLLPPTCILCDGKGQSTLDLCHACEADLPWLGPRCRTCSVPLSDPAICGMCQRFPPPFDRSFAAFRYEFPIDHLVLAFKRAPDLSTGNVLAHLLARAFLKESAESQCPRLLIPVPLHPRRQRQRGFNQALEIALVLQAHLPRSRIAHQVVKRVLDSAEQKSLSADARARNVRDAFAVTGTFSSEAVAIVDDVVTTGSTVKELALALRHHGAGNIQVISIARTATH